MGFLNNYAPGLVSSQLARVWRTYDCDNDGYLNLEEFTRFMHSRPVSRWMCGIQVSGDLLEIIFHSCGKTNTGLLSFIDFYEVVDVDKFQTRIQLRIVLDDMVD